MRAVTPGKLSLALLPTLSLLSVASAVVVEVLADAQRAGVLSSIRRWTAASVVGAFAAGAACALAGGLLVYALTLRGPGMTATALSSEAATAGVRPESAPRGVLLDSRRPLVSSEVSVRRAAPEADVTQALATEVSSIRLSTGDTSTRRAASESSPQL